MKDLIVESRETPNEEGSLVEVTPESAGWDWVGFEVVRLESGQTLERETGGQEICLVLLSGRCNISAGENEWEDLGERESVFDGPPLLGLPAAERLLSGGSYE